MLRFLTASVAALTCSLLTAATAHAAEPQVIAVDPPQVVAVPSLSPTFSSDAERVVSQRIAADAAPRPLASSLEPSSRYRFYGWQNMLVEGLGATSVALLGVASLDGSSRSGDFALAGGLGAIAYFGGGVVVHLVHDNLEKAVGSLGFTIGLPATGALIGLAAGEAGCAPREEGCAETPAAWGALIGVLAAPVFDGLILGWEKKHSGAPRMGSVSRGPTMVPTMSTIPGGVMFGVAGNL